MILGTRNLPKFALIIDFCLRRFACVKLYGLTFADENITFGL